MLMLFVSMFHVFGEESGYSSLRFCGPAAWNTGCFFYPNQIFKSENLKSMRFLNQDI